VKYLLTVNCNVLPNNKKLVDHKPHQTQWWNPKLRNRISLLTVANSSCRKLQAFQLKIFGCTEADPCHISNCNRLIFRHVYWVVRKCKRREICCCKHDCAVGWERSSDQIYRAVLILATDRSAIYGRRLKLTYKFERRAMCCIWPSISVYFINGHDPFSSSVLEKVLICVLIVKVWSVRISRIL
jgi:hypothetical protein